MTIVDLVSKQAHFLLIHTIVTVEGVASMRATRAELLGKSSDYKYTLEYVITHFPEKSSENKIRLLEGYSILYIQVFLAMEHSKGQSQEYRSRQLIKYYVIII